MFTMGVNFKVAQMLLSNLGTLAEKFHGNCSPYPKFKESGKISDFLQLLNPMPEKKRKPDSNMHDALAELESFDAGGG
eukprot:gene21161-biopygen14706